MDALFSFSYGGINLLDVIIVFVVGFYAFEGYNLGFALAFVDLVSFIVSFVIALKFYGVFANFLMATLSLSNGIANAGSFFLVALLAEVGLTLVTRQIIRFIPPLNPET